MAVLRASPYRFLGAVDWQAKAEDRQRKTSNPLINGLYMTPIATRELCELHHSADKKMPYCLRGRCVMGGSQSAERVALRGYETAGGCRFITDRLRLEQRSEGKASPQPAQPLPFDAPDRHRSHTQDFSTSTSSDLRRDPRTPVFYPPHAQRHDCIVEKKPTRGTDAIGQSAWFECGTCG